MKSAISLFAVIAFAVGLSLPVVARTPPVDLTAAKALYAAASYEEALAALGKGDGEDGTAVGQIEQYRALCLLALGRTNEARQALEHLVAVQPRYTITDADVSPRIVSMLHEVRKQMLPSTAKDLYAKAKTSFESKQYASASAQFKDMFAILGDPDMPEQTAGLNDMKMLAEGFLALADAQVAAAPAAKPAAPTGPAANSTSPTSVTTPAPVPAPPPPVEANALKIYSAVDKNVVGPAEIERRMPAWTPANPADAKNQHVGVVGIVINEQGKVESAALQKSVAASYDADLLQAAKSWQFRPAKLNGQPVKYWKSYEIVLRAR